MGAGRPETGAGVGTWIATGMVLSVYFAFILTIAFVPAVMARPVVEGGLTSVGLVLGVALIVFCVALAMAFTTVRNRGGDSAP